MIVGTFRFFRIERCLWGPVQRAGVYLLLLKKGHLIISSLHLTRDEVNPLANVAFCFQDILVQPNRFQLDVDDPLVSDFTCSCLPV